MDKLVALYEQRLSKVPLASELEDGKVLIEELTAAVKSSQERETLFKVHFGSSYNCYYIFF